MAKKIKKIAKKIAKKKRLEIRIIDVPEKLYDSIQKTAAGNDRTMGKEVLNTIKTLY